VEQLIAAAAGYLIAVLWFDLMFDVQVLRHRGDALPEDTLASIAAYYRRVTTTASPMGRLVAVAMVVLLGALVAQLVRGDQAVWVRAASLPLAALAIGLAIGRTFGAARRLGGRADPPERQSAMARGILRDHVICLSAMTALLAVQVLGAAL
jgi:hypothetical protein